ncbi:MAG TPA: hypothetical protein VFL85_01285 [Candidatus Saccharimonadales bacterium]|nr:hypothetical protein [Candidatus Saccharimonadales bacterium]
MHNDTFPEVFPTIILNRSLGRYIEAIEPDIPAIYAALSCLGLSDEEIADTTIHISSRVKQKNEAVYRVGAYYGFQQRIALYHGMDLEIIQQQVKDRRNTKVARQQGSEAASRLLSRTLGHELGHRACHIITNRKRGTVGLLQRKATPPREEAFCREIETITPQDLVRVKIRTL